MIAGMTGMTTEMMIESAAHAPARLALVLRGLNQHFTMCGNHKIKDIRRIILQIRKGGDARRRTWPSCCTLRGFISFL